MNLCETITKLRKLTTANGCTPAEERAAAEKIGKLLMAHPEIAVGEEQTGKSAVDFDAREHELRARSYRERAESMRMQERMRVWEMLRKGEFTMNTFPGWDSWINAHAGKYEE